jgi:hypothetical protein
MFEALGVVLDQDGRLASEERERELAAEVRELELAIAEDHRRRDQAIDGLSAGDARATSPSRPAPRSRGRSRQAARARCQSRLESHDDR